MNGELAQVICLAAHGTKWLRDPSGPAPSLEGSSSTFRFVASVHFHYEGGPGTTTGGEHNSVGGWLESLQRSEADRLWLTIPEARTVSAPAGHSVDEHTLAGFANAGRWAVLATGTTKKQPSKFATSTGELWHATWTVGDRSAPDSRIWLVDYAALPAPDVPVVVPELDLAEEELRGALTDAHDLAVEQGLDNWAEWFEKALVPDPEMPYHPDMLPSDWPRLAQQCAARAAQAWVFGGMGSWNDLYLPGPGAQERYRQVSRRLYSAVLGALLAATNCPL